MKTLLKNARILKMTGEDIFIGEIAIENNKITYVGKQTNDEKNFDKVIDCGLNLLMPTFKDAHCHTAMVFLRSKADDLPLQEWLTTCCFPAEANLTGEDIYHLNKLGYLEYLSSGIGVNFDQYFFPKSIEKSSKDFGMRTVINLMPRKDFAEEELGKYFDDLNKENGLVSAIFGLHAEYTASDAEVEQINRLVHKYKVPFFTHLSETQREVKECFERRGVTPLEYFSQKGLFDFGGGIFHGIYLSDHDIELLKKYNLTVVTNPASNAKLASGICEIEKLSKAGVNIAIGTDGAASNNALDMFREMYLVGALSKLLNKDAAVTPADEILKMATVNGARAMGLNNCDVLEVGKLADIIMIDLKQPNMQPIHNIVKNIVYAGSKSNIKMTMIDGKILYYNNQYFVNPSVEEIYETANKVTKRLTK